jgi:hypothetical protein
MAIVTLTEASRLTGKSIRTIQRHVTTGKLSVACHDGDKKSIDTSELIRVYGEISDLMTHDKKHDMSRHDVKNDTSTVVTLTQEISFLRELLATTEKHNRDMLAEKDKRIDDLKNTVKLLEYKKESISHPWWKFWHKPS